MYKVPRIKNANTNLRLLHEVSNIKLENESQTLLNKMKTLNIKNHQRAVENHHLKVLQQQDNNKVQETKKSRN